MPRCFLLTLLFLLSLWPLHSAHSSMQATTLAPVSHRQLQPLRDYLWVPIAAGRSQRRNAGDALEREVTTGAVFALRGLFPFLEKERTLKR